MDRLEKVDHRGEHEEPGPRGQVAAVFEGLRARAAVHERG